MAKYEDENGNMTDMEGNPTSSDSPTAEPIDETNDSSTEEANESQDEKLDEIKNYVEKFMKKQNIETIYTTMGDKGLMLSYKENGDVVHNHIVGKKRNIADVSGAGDTVISVATLLTINGVDKINTAKIANIAGGLVCEEVGVVPINKEKLLKEI